MSHDKAPNCIARLRLSTIPASLIIFSFAIFRMVIPSTCTFLPLASTPNKLPVV